MDTDRPSTDPPRRGLSLRRPTADGPPTGQRFDVFPCLLFLGTWLGTAITSRQFRWWRQLERFLLARSARRRGFAVLANRLQENGLEVVNLKAFQIFTNQWWK